MSPRFGFVTLADRYCTGSSIMPQKKNPDVPELVRGKTGRVNGDLVALLTLMKAPAARLQQRQPGRQRAAVRCRGHADRNSLRVFAGMLTGLEVNVDAMRRAAAEGYATATDLADYLVRKGLPFREAHEAVARAVRAAAEQGKELAALGARSSCRRSRRSSTRTCTRCSPCKVRSRHATTSAAPPRSRCGRPSRRHAPSWAFDLPARLGRGRCIAGSRVGRSVPGHGVRAAAGRLHQPRLHAGQRHSAGVRQDQHAAVSRHVRGRSRWPARHPGEPFGARSRTALHGTRCHTQLARARVSRARRMRRGRHGSARPRACRHASHPGRAFRLASRQHDRRHAADQTSADWIEFWREQRLGYQLTLAARERPRAAPCSAAARNSCSASRNSSRIPAAPFAAAWRPVGRQLRPARREMPR